jgi:hypothetical protein
MSDKKAKPTCYTCGDDIIFDKNITSEKSGKQIPLDPETKKPHECPKPEPEQKNNQSFDEVAKEIKSENKEPHVVTYQGTAETGKLQQGFPISATKEYVDHTLARPSEVKIFSKNSPIELEIEYREFQIGKKFAWSRAQYQPVVLNGKVMFTLALYYEIAK